MFAGLLGASGAAAGTFVWDGGHNALDGWSKHQNWNPNQNVPPNDGSADLIFSGDVRLTPDVDGAAWSINSITFNNLAGAFSITGNTITLQGTNVAYAVSNDDADTQTFANALVLGSTQAWRANLGNLTFTGTITLGASNLTLTGASDTLISGAISGTGALVKTGTGSLTLAGANTYSGGTTVSAGTLRGNATSLQGNIANDAAIVFDQATAGTYSGVLSGTGSLNKTGAENLTLGAANTFTGATTISAGTLTLGAANALGDSTAVSIDSGATLALSAGSETVGSIAGAGNISLAEHTLTAGGDGSSTTFSGAISGTGAFDKTGSGMLTLSGANAYSGGTTVAAGTLRGDTTSLQGDILNNASVVFDQSTSSSYTGVLSGIGALTKTGAGNLTLGASNTYIGATTISAGTLTLGAADTLADSTAVTIASDATLALSAGDETVGSLAGAGSLSLASHTLTAGGDNTSTLFSGVISGTGGLAKTGSGTLTLSGANTYSGGTTVAAGTLRGDATSLQGDILNSASVVFDQATAGTYSGALSGTGTLTKSGTGTLTLAGSSTATGTTTVSTGTLALGASDRLADTAALALETAATFALGGYSEKVGTLTYHTAFLDFGAGGTTNYFLFGDGSAASTGTLTINNYDRLEGDELAFNGTLGTGFLDGVYFYGIGAGVVGDSGQTLAGYGGGWTFIRPDDTPFEVWDGGGSNNNWNQSGNWADDSAPGSSFSLKLEFAGSTRTAPVMNGSYNLNTLRFAADAASFTLGGSGTNSLTFGGTVASIIQLSASDQTINVPLNLTSTTVVETTGAGTLHLTGAISGDGGITKVGSNTLELAGANTYAGATTIREGTVVLKHGSALGASTAGTTVDAGATLELQNNITVGAEALALHGSLVNNSGANSFNGAISGAGTVTVGGGMLTLGGTAANTYTGTTTVNAGQLDLAKTAGFDAVSGALVIGDGSGSATARLLAGNQISDTSTVTLASGGAPVLDLNGFSETIGSLASDNTAASVQLGSGALTTGANNTSTTFAGVISGSGDLVKSGTGTFTLSGANTYAGNTTVSSGTLVVAQDTALGSTSGGSTVTSGATLELQNNITIGAEALTLHGSLLNHSGVNTFNGAISGTGMVIVDGGALTLGGTAANTYTGTTTVNAGQLDLAKTAGLNAVSGALVIGDGSGTDTVRLLASNQISNTSAVTLDSGGTPVFSLNGFSETIGSLASDNTAAAVQLGSGTLTTGSSNASTTFAGVISGSGDLVKTGSGTFTLSGENTYTGSTTVSGGTLALGGSEVLSDSTSLSLGYGTTLQLGGVFSENIGQFSYSDATLNFGATGTANHFLFGDDGTATGFLTVVNWTSGSDVLGILSTAAIDQAFLDNIFFSGIGVGIGAELSATASSVLGYAGDFYRLQPITTFVWDGGQNSGPTADQDNWSKSTNWNGNLAPAVGSGKALVMAGVVQTTNDMDGAFTVHSLLFRADAGPFTINSSTGDTLTVRGGGIYNESTTTQTLNVPIALGANQTWNTAHGDLIISGTAVINGAFNLTITGNHDTTISAALGGGSGGLVKNGTGTLTLSGANTYTGLTTINSGTVVARHDFALGDSTAGTTVASGATLQLENSITIGAEALTLDGTLVSASGANTYSGAISGTGAVTVNSGSLTLGGTTANTYSGVTTVEAGTLTVAKSGGVTAVAGDLVIGNSSSAATVSLGASHQISDTSAVTLASGGAVVFQVNGHTETIGSLASSNAAASVDLGSGGGSLTVGANQASTTFAGAISGSGDFTKTGAGTLTLANTNTFSGALTVSEGTLLAGANDILTAATALSVADGAVFDLASHSTTLGSLAGAGDVVLGSGTLVVGGNDASTLFSGSLAGTGTFEKLGAGVLTFDSDFTFEGTLQLTGGTLALTGAALVLDTLHISGDTTLDFGSSLSSILTAANLVVDAGVTLTISGWTEAVDYFYVQNGGGLVQGTAPLTQVVFGGFSPGSTQYRNFDHEVTPVPEPSTYGAFFVGGALAMIGWHRRRKRACDLRDQAEPGDDQI